MAHTDLLIHVRRLYFQCKKRFIMNWINQKTVYLGIILVCATIATLGVVGLLIGDFGSKGSAVAAFGGIFLLSITAMVLLYKE